MKESIFPVGKWGREREPQASPGPEVMAREGALMAALEAARKVETSHLVLKIYGATDALLLDLVRRDFD